MNQTPQTAGTKGLDDLVDILGSEAAAVEFEDQVLNAVSESECESALWREIESVRNNGSVYLHLYWDWLCEQAVQMISEGAQE